MEKTDSKHNKSPETPKEGIAKRLWDWTERFWPISILLMAFTFLSQLEQFAKFSTYLSYALHTWRNFIHGILELPLNTILKLLNLPTIDIHSPIPEVFTFFLLIWFSNSRKEQLISIRYNTIVWRVLEKIEDNTEKFRVTKYLRSRIKTKFELIMIWSNPIFATVLILSSIPALIVIFVLFNGSVRVSAFAMISLVVFDVSFGNFKSASGSGVFLSVVGQLVLIAALAMLLGAAALEVMIPASEEFIQRANDRVGIT